MGPSNAAVPNEFGGNFVRAPDNLIGTDGNGASDEFVRGNSIFDNGNGVESYSAGEQVADNEAEHLSDLVESDNNCDSQVILLGVKPFVDLLDG